MKKLFIVFAIFSALSACSVGGEICESFAWDHGITDRCLD